LSTRTAAPGDRFTLRVTEPAEFREATIEGHIANIDRSSRVSGRSLVTLNFDDIRTLDGRTYQFAGLLENINTRNGEIVRVDTEGTIRDQNQTTRTEERAAVGTAVGAIIGAIAGGGKGAAIGAILGAGAGAGSIYAEGRNDLYLDRGTELVIRAGAPYVGPR
jgi:outer membrane lipoprotein SlyB